MTYVYRMGGKQTSFIRSDSIKNVDMTADGKDRFIG